MVYLIISFQLAFVWHKYTLQRNHVDILYFPKKHVLTFSFIHVVIPILIETLKQGFYLEEGNKQKHTILMLCGSFHNGQPVCGMLHNLIIKKNHIFYSHRNGKENHVMSGGTKRVWSVSFDEPKKRKSYSSNPDGDLSKDRLPRPPSAPADGVGVLSVCTHTL